MAGIQAGTAYIPVKADMSSFGKEVETGTKQASSKVGSFAKTTAKLMGGAFAVKKVKDFFGASISGARDAMAIDRQTEAVIESTGGAAGISAKEVDELANKLQKTQTVNDEIIQSGANMILTFKNIRNEAGEGNEVFDKTVALASDMSVAMGQDMKSSSIQLGKALNDPVKGLASLGRVGVQFTDQQKEQIEAMVESGDTLGAQKVILEELEGQFGGSAAAQADASKKMALAWDDFQEVIGRLVVPIVDKLITSLTKVAEWAAANPGKVKAIAIVIGGALVLAFTAWAVSAAAAAAATIAAAAPIIAIGVAIAALVAGIIWAYNEWDIFRNVIDAVASFITGTVWPAIQSIAKVFTDQVIPAIVDVIGWYWDFYTTVFGVVRDVVAKMVELAMKIGEKVGAVIGFFGDMINKATELAGWVGEKVGEIWGFFSDLASDIWGIAQTLWDPIEDTFRGVVNGLIDAWNRLDFGIDIRVPGWVPGVGGKGFQVDDIFPDVPRLHTGGTFRAPSGEREGLAMLLDGERVLSPIESKQYGVGGSDSILMQIRDLLENQQLVLDTGAVAGGVRRADGYHHRRNG